MAIINEKQIVDYVSDTSFSSRRLMSSLSNKGRHLTAAKLEITDKAIKKLEEMARLYSFKLQQLLLSSDIDNVLIGLTINLDKSIIKDIDNINFTVAFKDNKYFKERYFVNATVFSYNAGKLILKVKY